MLHHIVMFKFKDSATEKKRHQAVKELKELGSKIPNIKEWIIAPSISESSHAYDLIQVSSFDNRLDLDEFRQNPNHVKTRELILEVADYATVDYED